MDVMHAFDVFGIVFGVALAFMLLMGASLVSWVLVYTVSKFYESWQTMRHPKPPVALHVDNATREYILAMRAKDDQDRRQRAIARRQGTPVQQTTEAQSRMELDVLKNMMKLGAPKEPPVTPAHRAVDRRLGDRAEYMIVKFPHGLDKPIYLCRKQSVRDAEGPHLKTAWAPLRSEAIRLDLASATRLARTLGQDVFAIGGNASARILSRRQQELKEIPATEAGATRNEATSGKAVASEVPPWEIGWKEAPATLEGVDFSVEGD